MIFFRYNTAMQSLFFFHTALDSVRNRLISRKAPVRPIIEDTELNAMYIALSNLPAEFLKPLTLQVVKGYSTAEIAQELNLTMTAVLTRLCRARKRLRAECGEDLGLDP